MQICGFQKEKKTVVRPNKNRCVLATKEKQYNFKPTYSEYYYHNDNSHKKILSHQNTKSLCKPTPPRYRSLYGNISFSCDISARKLYTPAAWLIRVLHASPNIIIFFSSKSNPLPLHPNFHESLRLLVLFSAPDSPLFILVHRKGVIMLERCSVFLL